MGGGLGCPLVVDADAERVGQRITDRRDRHTESSQRILLVGTQTQRQNDDGVHTTTQRHTREEVLLRTLVRHSEQQQIQTLAVQYPFNAGQHLAEEPGPDVGGDDGDRIGAAAGQARGDRRHDIVQLLCHFEHPPPGCS